MSVQTFLNQVFGEIANTVTIPAGHYVIKSPLDEFRKAVMAYCMTEKVDPYDIAKFDENFIRATDCWMQEAFAWWATADQIMHDEVMIGKALIAAAEGAPVFVPLKKPGDYLRPQFPDKGGLLQPVLIKAFRTLGQSMVVLGEALQKEIAFWQENARQIRSFAPALLLLVTKFRGLAESGEISDAAITSTLEGYHSLMDDWRKDLVLRNVDQAYLAVTFAQKLAVLQQHIIETGFALAAELPAIMAAVQELLMILDQWLAASRKAASVINVIKALASLPGRIIEGVVTGALRPAADATSKVLTTIAWILGGLVVLGVPTLVILRKTGVIEPINVHKLRRGKSKPVSGARSRRR